MPCARSHSQTRRVDPVRRNGEDGANGAFQTQQKPVVEQGRVVDTVGIGNQRIGQPRQLDQPMPVGVVARQPLDLEAEHYADPARATSLASRANPLRMTLPEPTGRDARR